STKEEFFHWENVFLSRGLATFSLDGPGQGETVTSLPMRADYEKAVSTALDTVLEESDVDAARLAVVGVSLGGFYATRAAAFDKRFRAVVNVSGGYEVGEGLGKRSPLQMHVFQDYSWTTSEEDARELGARMNLRGVAERVTQPMLVVIGGKDRVRDPKQTLRTAEEAPRSITHTFPEGNHVCFNVATRARPLIGDWVADQLRAALPASPAEGAIP
ncbi:MAG: alpha/beta fold hydrolase, partial [Microbacterium sp.]